MHTAEHVALTQPKKTPAQQTACVAAEGLFYRLFPQNRPESLGGGNSRCGHKGVLQSHEEVYPGEG